MPYELRDVWLSLDQALPKFATISCEFFQCGDPTMEKAPATQLGIKKVGVPMWQLMSALGAESEYNPEVFADVKNPPYERLPWWKHMTPSEHNSDEAGRAIIADISNITADTCLHWRPQHVLRRMRRIDVQVAVAHLMQRIELRSDVSPPPAPGRGFPPSPAIMEQSDVAHSPSSPITTEDAVGTEESVMCQALLAAEPPSVPRGPSVAVGTFPVSSYPAVDMVC